MSEIKPVYQLRVRFNLWEDQTKNQYEDSKFGDGVPRILYPAAAYEALQKENAELKEDLDDEKQKGAALWKNVENRCKEIDALQKENERLDFKFKQHLCSARSLLQKYCSQNAAQAKRIQDLEGEDEISAAVIEKCCNLLAQIAITLKGETEELARHGYHDLPELVAVLHLENELNKVQMQEMLTAMRRAVLALAFAAESSAAMKDDYNALSAAIAKAVASKNGE